MLQKGSGLNEYRRPPSGLDVLYAADYSHVSNNQRTCGRCDAGHIVQRPHRESDGSKVHYGLIASGDRVMRSAAKRDEQVRNLRDDILCFEMEAAGLTTESSYLVIRGISDYADSHKNDAWQHFAAAAAAACTKEVLTYLDPPAPTAAPAASPTAAPAVPSPDYNSGNGASFSGGGIQNLGSISVGRDFKISGR
ncbi:hypothetical protein CIB48_g10739 [Xylaria polymorpha]|nr:hypothetical protein CIB48_g10739 [Xylaria polymorpha]